MGGLGSGRQPSGRLTVEDCRSLDINRLNKSGVLVWGWIGSWRWSSDCEVVASINITGGRDLIVLDYKSRLCGGDWHDVRDIVPIQWQPCRFGGHRPLFSCPGLPGRKPCGKTVAKLFCGGRLYRCRHCYNLTYESRSETPSLRAMRRARKLRQRLGDDGLPGSELNARPKGMWRRTFSRVTNRIEDDEHCGLLGMEQFAKRLLQQAGGEKGYWT